MRYISARDFLRLQKEFPNIHFVDAFNILEVTRFSKTPAEVEFLRKAARLTDQAIAKTYAEAQISDTEKAIGDTMSYTAMQAGADRIAFNFVASGSRLTHGHHLGSATRSKDPARANRPSAAHRGCQRRHRCRGPLHSDGLRCLDFGQAC